MFINLLIVKIRDKNLYYAGNITENQVPIAEEIANRVFENSNDNFDDRFIDAINKELQVNLLVFDSIKIARIKKREH